MYEKMLTEFEERIADFTKANRLFEFAGKILLAVSGGADSTALLYAICALKAEGVFSAELLCAHINHQLRGSESDGDEDFVVKQADRLNLPITTRRADVRGFARKNKLSIETAARKLRIESLLNIAKSNNVNHVATAHQKNDNAETIIQRLRRGTGFRGLGGIWPMRKFDEATFTRPLLCVTRQEIIEYLEKRNLKWRVDRTNDNCRYRRNFIRHRLLPELQKYCSGSIVEQLFKLSEAAQRFYKLITNETEKVWADVVEHRSGKVILDLEKLTIYPPSVKVELIRRSLAALGCGERDFTQGHYEKILESTKQKTSGRKIELPGRLVVLQEYEKLIFAHAEKKETEEKTDKSIEINVPGRTEFGDYLIEASILDAADCNVEKFKTEKTQFVEWFDLDKLKMPLAVRFRKTGDRFQPLGSAGKKKVGKFLTAARVSQELRQKILIIADSERIIWVWPIRINDQARITSETQKILQLQINN
jgi:tRNA(Ile)-lysidine synthase